MYLRVIGTIFLLFLLTPHTFAAEKTNSEQTKVLISNNCASALRPPDKAAQIAAALIPILTAIIPTAVQFGADMVGSVLDEAAKDNEVTKEATANGEFYRITGGKLNRNSEFGCITLINGLFEDIDIKDASRTPTRFSEAFTESQKKSLASQGLIEDPKFYLEAQVHFSKDNSAFRLEPVYFYFKAVENRSWYESNPKRDIAIALNFLTCSDEKPFAATTLVFKNVEEKTKLKGTAISQMGSRWMSIMPLSGKVKDLIEKVDSNTNSLAEMQLQNNSDILCQKEIIEGLSLELCAEERSAVTSKKIDNIDTECKTTDSIVKAKNKISHENDKLTIKIAQLKMKSLEAQLKVLNSMMPFSIVSLITETKRAGKYIKYSAAAFQTSKSGLTEKLKTALSPEELQKKKDELQIKEEQNLEEIFTAEQAVAEAEKNYNNATTEDDKKIEDRKVKLAKLKANYAYRKAGKPEPYSLGF